MFGVAVQVLQKLLLGNVGRGAIRMRHVWQRAELLGQVKLDAVVGAVVPQRRAAVLTLNDEVGDGTLAEACRRRQSSWSSTDDQHSQLHFCARWMH